MKKATDPKIALANVIAERDAAIANFAAERKERIELLLENAMLRGKITIAERTGFRLKLANVETFDTALIEVASRGQVVHVRSVTEGLGNQKVAIANEQDRAASVRDLIKKEMASGLDYDEAFETVRRQNPRLFALMKHPQK